MRTKGFLERGLPVFQEPGRAYARGSGALPRPPEYQEAHNLNELVMSRRHSIKHPELETRRPAPTPSRWLRDELPHIRDTERRKMTHRIICESFH
jgi:hypothetical protein